MRTGWHQGARTGGQAAAVVNYIRTHFGNDFPDAVSDDDARAAR
jgi:hypothetical protein